LSQWSLGLAQQVRQLGDVRLGWPPSWAAWPQIGGPAHKKCALVLLRDPANDAATYAAENIECGMVKSFRQARQLL
jgi:hypothetical protein